MTTLVQNEAVFNTVLGMLVLIHTYIHIYILLCNCEQHLVPEALDVVVRYS